MHTDKDFRGLLFGMCTLKLGKSQSQLLFEWFWRKELLVLNPPKSSSQLIRFNLNTMIFSSNCKHPHTATTNEPLEIAFSHLKYSNMNFLLQREKKNDRKKNSTKTLAAFSLHSSFRWTEKTGYFACCLNIHEWSNLVNKMWTEM